MRNSEFSRLCMQFPHMQATQSCVPMTVNPTPMPVLIPCHRHLTFGRQLCSNTGKSERNINGSEFPRHQLTTGTRGHLSRTTQIAVSPQRPNSRTGEPTPGQRKEKEMPRIKAMTMRYLRSNFFTKVSAANEMRATYSLEPTYRLVDGDPEVPYANKV